MAKNTPFPDGKQPIRPPEWLIPIVLVTMRVLGMVQFKPDGTPSVSDSVKKSTREHCEHCDVHRDLARFMQAEGYTPDEIAYQIQFGMICDDILGQMAAAHGMTVQDFIFPAGTQHVSREDVDFIMREIFQSGDMPDWYNPN